MVSCLKNKRVTLLGTAHRDKRAPLVDSWDMRQVHQSQGNRFAVIDIDPR